MMIDILAERLEGALRDLQMRAELGGAVRGVATVDRRPEAASGGRIAGAG